MMILELYRQEIEVNDPGGLFQNYTLGSLRARLFGVRIPVRLAFFISRFGISLHV